MAARRPIINDAGTLKEIPTGDTLPSSIVALSTSTATDITGLLKGNGTSVSAAAAGTDYIVTTDALRTSLIVGE